ncbi:MAG: methyltransferase domain-containing protein [Bauldia sp.]|nr:methyltransferase domain-containing protein [Bauldia sp.]
MPSPSSRRSSQSWDGVAGWYAGWSGAHGSRHHRTLAVPAAVDLLALRRGERVLDIGCGPGPLATAVARRSAVYTGVDSSRRLLAVGRQHHGGFARFIAGDATRLAAVLGGERFDAACFLLSLQDIDPLEAAIASAASVLTAHARIVIVMTHPCFRVPRQSGWGWDERRKLRYRRIDSYLGRLAVPMERNHDGPGSTRSFHRPLGDYFAALAAVGFAVDALREIPGEADAAAGRAERTAAREIPLFLALRARRG